MSKKFIIFRDWNGEKIDRKSFDYNEEDEELVEFYNKDAKKCITGRVSTIKNIFDENNKLIGYFAVAMSSTKATLLFNRKRAASFPHPTLLLGRLLLSKDCRGRKIGTKTIDYIVMLAQKLNEFAACRFIAVDSKSYAIGFYEKMGFEQVGYKKEGGKQRFLQKLFKWFGTLFGGSGLKDPEATVSMLFDLKP